MKVGMILGLFLLTMPGPAAFAGTETATALSVEDAVREAISHNTGVLNAEKNRRLFQEKVNEYWAYALPSISASASYARNIEIPSFFIAGNFIQIGSANEYTASVNAAQTVWAAGKVRTGVRIADLLSRNSDEQARATRLLVGKAVRSLYYDVLLASETAAIQKESLDIERQHLTQIEEQFRYGLSSDLTILRQKVQVANSEPAVTKALNLYEIGMLQLKNLLGKDPDDRVTLSERLETVLGETPGLEDFYAKAMEKRPEIRQMRLNLSVAEENIKIERAGHYPYLQAFAGRQISANSNSLIPGAGQSAWSSSAGLSLSLPIFSGGATSARVRQAEIQKQETEENLNQAVRDVRVEVKTAWLTLKEARERALSQQTVVEQARKALKATEERFKSGLASQLELNDAVYALNTSQLLRVNAVRDSCVALANLMWASGE